MMHFQSWHLLLNILGEVTLKLNHTQLSLRVPNLSTANDLAPSNLLQQQHARPASHATMETTG